MYATCSTHLILVDFIAVIVCCGCATLILCGHQRFFPRSRAAGACSWPLLSSAEFHNVCSCTSPPPPIYLRVGDLCICNLRFLALSNFIRRSVAEVFLHTNIQAINM
jgi:hypothetical protein